MTRVTGVDQHLRRLAQRAKAVRQEVGKAVVIAAELVAAEAVASITADWISGPDHVPSDPGEPPNADTGRLHGAIAVVRRAELSADVVSAAPYADLEFGTARAAARPYLRPATAKKRRDAVALIVQAVRRGRAVE
ncbi:HK97 gp10 family phage protein [Mycobacterium sp. KBS0706]|uniref:HK97 gp10 family phage protein n=1 Tax=Mycobacterium sp. KBS0706 TaxID=2578109 RepID=UPI00110F8720|nr:HK97 gp10 family phage protein [Mycobacterium sp. KBS0706]TSD85620.1 HK97 gp10 family phage protein [Mycobacterium sp. KBS0706]